MEADGAYDGLQAPAFGNFEVYNQTGVPIRFLSKNSKQLPAYLVDKRGSRSQFSGIAIHMLEKTGMI